MIAFASTEARDYCREVVRQAKEQGVLALLVEKLQYLARYSNRSGGYYPKDRGGDTRCVLWKDRARMSFNFAMDRREPGETEFRPWFNGGLIFHDDHWGVHT